eukprot:gene27805-8275_t
MLAQFTQPHACSPAHPRDLARARARALTVHPDTGEIQWQMVRTMYVLFPARRVVWERLRKALPPVVAEKLRGPRGADEERLLNCVKEVTEQAKGVIRSGGVHYVYKTHDPHHLFVEMEEGTMLTHPEVCWLKRRVAWGDEGQQQQQHLIHRVDDVIIRKAPPVVYAFVAGKIRREVGEAAKELRCVHTATQLGDELLRLRRKGMYAVAGVTYASAQKPGEMLRDFRYGELCPAVGAVCDEAHEMTKASKLTQTEADAQAAAEAAGERVVPNHHVPLDADRFPVSGNIVSVTATPRRLDWRVQFRKQPSFDDFEKFGVPADILTLGAVQRETIAGWDVIPLAVPSDATAEEKMELVLKTIINDLAPEDVGGKLPVYPAAVSFHDGSAEAFDFARFAYKYLQKKRGESDVLRRRIGKVLARHVYRSWTNAKAERGKFGAEPTLEREKFNEYIKAFCTNEGFSLLTSHTMVGRIQREMIRPDRKRRGKVIVPVDMRNNNTPHMWKKMMAMFATMKSPQIRGEPYLDVFSHAPEMDKVEKEKKKPDGNFEDDEAKEVATTQEEEDKATLDTVYLRCFADTVEEGVFIEYADSLAKYAATLPGKLRDVQSGWVDEEGRRVGLWWDMVKIQVENDWLGGDVREGRTGRLLALLRVRLLADW